MSDFTAIGQLVTEARNLLDSIKGGAIRVMQKAFDDFLLNVNGEWALKKKQVDNEALAALERVNTDTVISELGFEALNYNDDFLDTVTSNGNEWPVGMRFGLSSSENVDDYLQAEVIRVLSGEEAVRPDIVKDLFGFVFGDREKVHFARDVFKVLKITVKQPYDTWVGVTKDWHQSTCTKTTNMTYIHCKTTGYQWQQTRFSHNISHGYKHFVLEALKGLEVGESLYIALPTTVSGGFPAGKKHWLLNNARNLQVRGDSSIKAELGA